MTRFPIVIFSYNRPEYLEELFISLSNCKNIKNRKIFFFCDGPKNKKDKINIDKIRKLIKKYNYFNFSKIEFNKKNLGLYKNIKKGCNYVFKKNTAAIILEDDLVVHEKFLIFFDYYLKKFNRNSEVASISGFSYINILNKKIFCYRLRRLSSWGWGTWRRNWIEFNKFNLNNVNLDSYNLKLVGNDFSLLAWAKKNFLINSWAVDFNIFCLIKNYFSIQPSQSLVINNGQNLSGTNYFNFFLSNKVKKNNFLKNRFDIVHLRKIIIKKSRYLDLMVQSFHKKSLRLIVLQFFIFFYTKFK